jgi:hypothetical protein
MHGLHFLCPRRSVLYLADTLRRVNGTWGPGHILVSGATNGSAHNYSHRKQYDTSRKYLYKRPQPPGVGQGFAD